MTAAVNATAPAPARRQLVLMGAALVALTASGPFLHHVYGGKAFLVIVAISAAAAAWAAWLGDRIEARTGLWIVLLAAGAMRLALVLSEPYFSTDVFRYIWDGRVQAAGINPYRWVPTAPELEVLRDPAIFPHINRADYATTIYPPAAQMVFLLLTRFGESVTVFKLGLLCFEALAIASLIGVLRQLGRPVTRVAAYAWHPLPVWEIAVNGHLDAAMLALMMAGVCVFLAGRELRAGALVAIASLVKPLALFALPAFWRPWDLRLPLVVAGVAVLLYLPYLSVGWGVLGFLAGYLQEEGFGSGEGFRYLGLIERLTGPIANGTLLYLLVAGLVLVVLALRIGFRTDRSPSATIRAIVVLTTAFLVLLTPHYPWYYLVLAPFLALSGALTPWVLTVGGFLLYDVIPGDRLPAFALREATFRLAALAAIACDVWAWRRSTATGPEPGDARQ